MKLHIGQNFSLPLDFVTQSQAILAKKRVGKSYTASVQAEELLKAGQQIAVIDPTGAWWGLKSSADGKHEGFHIAVFGGEHADVPLEESAGETIAQAIVEQRFSRAGHRRAAVQRNSRSHVISQRPPKNMVAAWAGYSPLGGAFGNPIGALRSKGLIDYPAPGVVSLTEEGRAKVGSADPPDQEEIWRRIEATCSGPEKKILRALIDNAGDSEISKEQLAEKAGYSPIGGAFGNPIGALRTKGLLDYPRQGVVKAAEWLFLN